MWIFAFFIFGIVQGTFAEVDCSTEPFLECDRPKLLSYIPQEISEYNRLCPKVPAFLRCLKEFQDECAGMAHIFESQEYYDGIYGAFSDLCEKGTLFNTVAIEHLRCFNETFTKTSCPEKMKAITGPYRTVEKSTVDEYEYSLPIEIMCLQDILESSCIAAEIGRNCGQVALEATLEFLRRTFYVEEICGTKSAEYLLTNLDEFTLDKEQRELVIATLGNIIIARGKDTM
ncbi:uncharacterized protein LOC129984761 [Argiope bruennichi]|uniref:uncharacterized protein LOC129984761 n=1 Tax=Argiope bruennichi TaxID=94029 RepID=UPI0024959D80|nr:uncharacterized protein LOC129984761 [Argiope bruennichi]